MTLVEAIVAVGTPLAIVLGWYLKVRLENAATRHDVDAVLRRVEEMKASVSAETHRGSLRYTREFEILEELSQRAWQLERLAQSMRPEVGVQPATPELFEELLNSGDAIVDFANEKRPFYSPDVWEAIKTLHSACIDAWATYSYLTEDHTVPHLKRLEAIRRHSGEINTVGEALRDAIRHRVTSWEAPTIGTDEGKRPALLLPRGPDGLPLEDAERALVPSAPSREAAMAKAPQARGSSPATQYDGD